MCWWVRHSLSMVHGLLLWHWCEHSVMPVLRLWSILVELNLRVSHLVLVLIHYASRLASKSYFLLAFCNGNAGTMIDKEDDPSSRSSILGLVMLDGGIQVSRLILSRLLFGVGQGMILAMLWLDYGIDTVTSQAKRKDWICSSW